MGDENLQDHLQMLQAHVHMWQLCQERLPGLACPPRPVWHFAENSGGEGRSLISALGVLAGAALTGALGVQRSGLRGHALVDVEALLVAALVQVLPLNTVTLRHCCLHLQGKNGMAEGK